MRHRPVLWLLGRMLRPFSILLLAPAAIDWGHGDYVHAAEFLGTAAIAFIVGSLLARVQGATSQIGRVESMAIVALSWLAAALLGSIPYLTQEFGFTDSLFESMSGFTTTGSTIFLTEDFARISPGLHFWRCMTQWLGGMGIIVLFVAVLPALAVAGRQMFFAEAPGPEEESLTPRIRHTAAALWRLYIALTALEMLLLWRVGGMSPLDAICHAFTTLAAGGFSPHPQSVAGHSAAAQWIILPFMFLAGASFALQYRALTRPGRMVRDAEFVTYAGIVLFGGLIVAVLVAPAHGFADALRHGLFQAASLVTTTGYASEDFNLWSHGTLIMLGVFFFIGGCAGSAGGGPKVVRYIVIAKFLSRELLQAIHPRAVKVIRLGGRPIGNATLRQILGFFVAYFGVFALAAVAVAIIENDLSTGVTGSIVTLGNIGPGFGRLGPMETFGTLTTASKLILILNMWIGRLEVMTVLVLLHPHVLRNIRRRR